jgi:hypothetical protein
MGSHGVIVWKPPLPDPLLHKCVEERGKKRVVVIARCARKRPGLL